MRAFDFANYDEVARDAIRPVFVSRAVDRRRIGAAHKETIYSQPASLIDTSSVKQRVALSELTMNDLEKLVDPQRNVQLYGAIRKRLADYVAAGGKFTKTGNKAFPRDKPLRKPDKYGVPNGPEVRAVQLLIQVTGLRVREGIAKHESLVKLSFFRKGGKFFPAPTYVADLSNKNRPLATEVVRQIQTAD